MICAQSLGANSKVSTLIQLHRQSPQPVVVVSDADVCVPPDFLLNFVGPLREPSVGLVTCFYRLANPSTLAMQWEAIAVNADFWSQVLQSESLKPLDFALGAVMATTREQLDAIGGFEALADYLADDYQIGHRIALAGGRIILSPVVVECWEPPKNWRDIWRHQLRWARTIRVCQPLPYFFSILSNATLWPLLSFGPAIKWGRQLARSWKIGSLTIDLGFEAAISWTFLLLLVCLAARIVSAVHLQCRLNRSVGHWLFFWLVPVKDLLNVALWALAFLGNTVEWRGQRHRVRKGGKLVNLKTEVNYE